MKLVPVDDILSKLIYEDNGEVIENIILYGIDHASVRGKLVKQGSNLRNSIGFDLTDESSFGIKIANSFDSSDIKNAIVGVDGSFQAVDLKSGTYNISLTNQHDATPLISIPHVAIDGSSEDKGIITLSSLDYNFKTEFTPVSDFLFDGSSYKAKFQVKNVGKTSVKGVNYQLHTPESCIQFTKNKNGILNTIDPGELAEVEVEFSIAGMEFVEEKKVPIQVILGDVRSGKWDDLAFIDIYKVKVEIDINTLTSVSGVLVFNDRKLVPISASHEAGSSRISIPYITNYPYKIILSAATRAQEAVYSIAINAESVKEDTLKNFFDTAVFEPNDLESEATKISLGDSLVSYLHVGDLDGFAVTFPPLKVTHSAVAGGNVPIDNAEYLPGQRINVLGNRFDQNRVASIFLGWNTIRDGSGETFRPGAVHVIGWNSINLYPQWLDCGSCNNLYARLDDFFDGTWATTPSGKELTLENGVWVEAGSGNRVLAADGSDSWARGLNPDGRSYNVSTYLNKVNVAGRVCPTNIFVPGNPTATGKCLYFDSGNVGQRLDAPVLDHTTDQMSLGALRLGYWNTSSGGNGSAPSWYEGNIETCAAKGMRLPTLYETKVSDPGANNKPVDANVTFAPTTGVPGVGTSWTWTGSAKAASNNSKAYWMWNGNSVGDSDFDESGAVRCVTPAESNIYTITYDANGASSGTAPISQSFAAGVSSNIARNSEPLVKNGLGFVGWNTLADGGGNFYMPRNGGLMMPDSNLTLFAQYSADWTRQLGIAGHNISGVGITNDAFGSVYVTGSTDGNLDGKTLTGNRDLFVTKYDSFGTRLWTRLIGHTDSYTTGMGIVNDNEGSIYVTGDTSGSLDGNIRRGLSDLLIIKMNSSGEKIWSRQLGTAGSYSQGRSITVDVFGNLYVAGTTNGSLDGNTLEGATDTIIVKYDSAGTKIWSRQFGGTGHSTITNSITSDRNGDIYITGWTDGALDNNALTGVQHVFVVKFDSIGTKIWTRELGVPTSSKYSVGQDIASDVAGNIYVTGDTTGNLDGNFQQGYAELFVVKYNSTGTRVWTRQFGVRGSFMNSFGITANVDGNFYITGMAYGSLDGNTLIGSSDYFVSKYNSSGIRLWTKQWGISSNGSRISSDLAGNLFVAGVTNVVNDQFLFVHKIVPVTNTVRYNANGATSGSAPADQYVINGGGVSTAANSGLLSKSGYSFAGWSTSADGSGITYVAGSSGVVVSNSNLTLYAKWFNGICGATGDSCYNYDGVNNGTIATTPSGKSLTFINGVWVEASPGTRVLASDGSDSWAYQLNPDGRSYSTNFLDKMNVAGRACPTNVFIPGDLVATGKCLYYDSGNPVQTLDAIINDGMTNQSTYGSYRLGQWNTSAGGNGTNASWYEGNIQTCAAKGMRLPLLYETSAPDPGDSSKPTDALPSFSAASDGIPSVGVGNLTWTASAYSSDPSKYWFWWGNVSGSISYTGLYTTVRCVVP